MKSLVRASAAVCVAGVVSLASVGAALAAPLPDRGPDTGGTRVTVPAPEPVTLTDLAAGDYHVIASGSDGRNYAWGLNDDGRDGVDGDHTQVCEPTAVAAPAGVTLSPVAAGYQHSLGIGSDGHTYAWGGNDSGSLGDGTEVTRPLPQRVSAPEGIRFTQVSAGSYHSLALGSDGNTYTWGYNGASGFAYDPRHISLLPVQLATPAGVRFTEVAAGRYFSLALGSDHRVYAWGDNTRGQLGDGTVTNHIAPAPVALPDDVTVTAIAAGTAHALAVTDDGRIFGWGDYRDADHPEVAVPERQLTPTPVAGADGLTFTHVAAGFSHSAAVAADGSIYTWGANDHGQLGTGSRDSSTVPVRADTAAGVTFDRVHAGYKFTAAIGSDQRAYTWGSSTHLALGTCSPVDALTPTPVNLPRVAVTGVTFDGIAGTQLRDTGDGTWSVTTPAHAAGPVDVVVSATVGGAAREPVTYAAGFTYEATEAPAPAPGADTPPAPAPGSDTPPSAATPIAPGTRPAGVDAGAARIDTTAPRASLAATGAPRAEWLLVAGTAAVAAGIGAVLVTAGRRRARR